MRMYSFEDVQQKENSYPVCWQSLSILARGVAGTSLPTSLARFANTEQCVARIGQTFSKSYVPILYVSNIQNEKVFGCKIGLDTVDNGPVRTNPASRTSSYLSESALQGQRGVPSVIILSAAFAFWWRRFR